jgi:hypothetical protein
MASAAAAAGIALSASGPSAGASPSAIRPPDVAMAPRKTEYRTMRKPSRVRVAPREPSPVRPEGHRRASDAGSRQQPRRGRPAERHLRALAQPEALRRAAAHEPEEGDVAGEGEQLEHGTADDPARIGVEGALQSVSKSVQRPARHDDRGRGRRGQRGGDGCPAGERAHVEGRDEDVGVWLAEGHDGVDPAPLSASAEPSTSWRPDRMPAGRIRLLISIRGAVIRHSGGIHRPGVRRAAPPALT